MRTDTCPAEIAHQDHTRIAAVMPANPVALGRLAQVKRLPALFAQLGNMPIRRRSYAHPAKKIPTPRDPLITARYVKVVHILGLVRVNVTPALLENILIRKPRNA